MRYSFLLLVILSLFACSKKEFDPSDPKNGQTAELSVGHYAAADNQMLFLLPKGERSTLSLRGFDGRELGYTYKIKARVHFPKDPPQDGPDRWFEFVQLISKERYTGKESFEISLLSNNAFGTTLAFGKNEGGSLYYSQYTFRPENDSVKNKLEEVLLLRKKIQENPEYAAKVSVKAIVTHDPDNFGKGYLVHEVKVGLR